MLFPDSTEIFLWIIALAQFVEGETAFRKLPNDCDEALFSDGFAYPHKSLRSIFRSSLRGGRFSCKKKPPGPAC